jgi:hypothetical protein
MKTTKFGHKMLLVKPHPTKMESVRRLFTNYIKISLILIIGWIAFPNYVKCQDLGLLFRAAIVVLLAGLVGSGICFVLSHVAIALANIDDISKLFTMFLLIVLIAIMCISYSGAIVLSLFLVSKYVSGFCVSGIWTYVIMTIIVMYATDWKFISNPIRR